MFKLFFKLICAKCDQEIVSFRIWRKLVTSSLYLEHNFLNPSLQL